MGVGGLFKKFGKFLWKGFRSETGQTIVTMVIPPQYQALVHLARRKVEEMERSAYGNEARRIEVVTALAKAVLDGDYDIRPTGSDYDALIAVALKELKGEAKVEVQN